MTDTELEQTHPATRNHDVVAELLTTLVEEGWQARKPITSWHVGDGNDWYVHLGYVSAFRLFQAVRLLVDHGRAEAALMMTRSLVETIIRSLYLVESPAAEVRQVRLRRAEWYSIRHEEKRQRALGKRDDAEELKRIRLDLETTLTGQPDPQVSDMAKRLGLHALYDDLYRLASVWVHGSLLAMTDVFTAEIDAKWTLADGIPLSSKDPELSRDALAYAINAYARFLELADDIVKLGIAERASAAIQGTTQA